MIKVYSRQVPAKIRRKGISCVRWTIICLFLFSIISIVLIAGYRTTEEGKFIKRDVIDTGFAPSGDGRTLMILDSLSDMGYEVVLDVLKWLPEYKLLAVHNIHSQKEFDRAHYLNATHGITITPGDLRDHKSIRAIRNISRVSHVIGFAFPYGRRASVEAGAPIDKESGDFYNLARLLDEIAIDCVRFVLLSRGSTLSHPAVKCKKDSVEKKKPTGLSKISCKLKNDCGASEDLQMKCGDTVGEGIDKLLWRKESTGLVFKKEPSFVELVHGEVYGMSDDVHSPIGSLVQTVYHREPLFVVEKDQENPLDIVPIQDVLLGIRHALELWTSDMVVTYRVPSSSISQSSLLAGISEVLGIDLVTTLVESVPRFYTLGDYSLDRPDLEELSFETSGITLAEGISAMAATLPDHANCNHTSLIMTTYLIGKRDPVYNKMRKAEDSYLDRWKKTLHYTSGRGVILSSGLKRSFQNKHANKYLSFVNTRTISKYSTNDVRFLMYVDYLRGLESKPEYVLLTDLRDVAFGLDPIEFMRNMTRDNGTFLFIGNEEPHTSKANEGPTTGKIARCYGKKALRENWVQGRPLNAGVIGGRYGNMMFFLELMEELLWNRYGTAMEGKNCNMADINFLCHHILAEGSGLKIFTGAPFTSPFTRKLDFGKREYCIYHK